MTESAEARGVVGTDATAQQERCGAVVMSQYAPVELTAVAADELCLRVEEEKIGDPFIKTRLQQVVASGDAEGFDNEQPSIARRAQVAQIGRRLAPVQLHHIESEGFHVLAHHVERLVDEHPYPLRPRGQIGWTLGDTATGVLPEDETHPVDAESLYGANVFGFAHAADLHNHSCAMNCRRLSPGDAARMKFSPMRKPR